MADYSTYTDVTTYTTLTWSAPDTDGESPSYATIDYETTLSGTAGTTLETLTFTDPYNEPARYLPPLTQLHVFTITTHGSSEAALSTSDLQSLSASSSSPVVYRSNTVAASSSQPNVSTWHSASLTTSSPTSNASVWDSATAQILASSSTAPTSAPSPQPSISNVHSARTFSSGALAGIAGACAMCGALLAFAVAWCIFRRRRRQLSMRASSTTRPETWQDGSSKHALSPDTMVECLKTSKARPLIESVLPAPMRDREVAHELCLLSVFIERHATSYFGSDVAQGQVHPEQRTETAQNLAQILDYDAPCRADAMVPLLANSATRVAAVRVLLAWAVLSNIELTSRPETTLLPPELAECMESMDDPTSEEEGTLPSWRRHRAMLMQTDRMLLLSKWRHISGALLQSRYGSGVVAPQDPRRRNIEALVADLNAVLEPYASSATVNDRVQDLRELINQGAHVGFAVFAQPTVWHFDWAGSTRRHAGGLVVYPALLLVGDDRGQRHGSPSLFHEEQVVAIDPAAL